MFLSGTADAPDSHGRPVGVGRAVAPRAQKSVAGHRLTLNHCISVASKGRETLPDDSAASSGGSGVAAPQHRHLPPGMSKTHEDLPGHRGCRPSTSTSRSGAKRLHSRIPQSMGNEPRSVPTFTACPPWGCCARTPKICPHCHVTRCVVRSAEPGQKVCYSNHRRHHS
jgi:hypothetical protein